MSALHGERVKTYADLIAAATSDEIAPLRRGDRIDARQLAVAIALHVAVRVVFSVADAHRRDQYTRAIKALMAANTAPLMLLPALHRELGGRGPWARLLRLRDDLDQLLSGDMAERSGQDTPPADMLALLLSAADDDGHRHTEQQIHDQLRTLLAAGHETSATSLAWALYHIYRDDSVRTRLQSELASCTTPAHMMALPYLDAVIKETLRMHPPVPIVLRRFTESMMVDGVACAPGEIAGIALYALHYNPMLWSDPDHFDPERFIERRVSPFEYAPFGGGHRRCIGAAFAASELAIALGIIVSTLDLRMPGGERNRRTPRSAARGIAVAPSRPIRLEVIDSR